MDKIKNTLPLQNHPEYGLLNRLDNATCGLLYFATSDEAYDTYKRAQKQGKTNKIYYATVYGKVRSLFFEINFPIAHHKFDTSKMVCGIHKDGKLFDRNGKQIRYRGKLHFVSTYCEQESYDPVTNTTILKVTIQKGIRHQIRVHLAFWGNSIVNDTLYTPKKFQKKLKYDFFGGNIGLTCAGLYIDFDTL